MLEGMGVYVLVFGSQLCVHASRWACTCYCTLMHTKIFLESFIWLKVWCDDTFWACGSPNPGILNITGGNSFKVKQKRHFRVMSKETSRYSYAIIRVLQGQKFKRLVTCSAIDAMFHSSLVYSLVYVGVCVLCWLTAGNESLCFWRQRTSFVCLVIHGVFCLFYPWITLTHWGFH